MGSEIEISETPNWLKELEAKRERRLKTKLGHELGAGAPCLTCEEKCPGLDLHFWRKICKNCKCSKENHEVQDDDIYGWAQDELLGTKVNRLKRKIVLPGRKDEVELEWAPNGQKETIDKYLKTLPPELLPIKGSQAAQDRKQLLKKQIPIHDIDPTLCHELTDEELKKMQEYVAHIKQSSVGVGHLIQISINKGMTHVFDKNDAMFLINNVPKGIVSSENIILQGSDNSVSLKNFTNQFGSLDLKEEPRLGVQEPYPVIPTENDEQNPTYTNIRNKHYNLHDAVSSPRTENPREVYNPKNKGFLTEDIQVPQEQGLRNINYCDNLYENIPMSPSNVLDQNQILANPGGMRNIPYHTNRMYENSNIKNLVPSAFVPIKHSDINYYDDGSYNSGALDMGTIRELPYPSQFVNDHYKDEKNLPNYNPGAYAIFNEHQHPAFFEPIKDIRYFSGQNIDELQDYPEESQLSKPNYPHKLEEGDLSGITKNIDHSQFPDVGIYDPRKCQVSRSDNVSNTPDKIKGVDNLYGSQVPMSNNFYSQDFPVENVVRSQIPSSNDPHKFKDGALNEEENGLSGIRDQINSPLPRVTPGKTNLYENQQTPAKIKSIKDLAYSTYDSPPEGQNSEFHNLSVKDRLNLFTKGELPSFTPKKSSTSYSDLSPNKFTVRDERVSLGPTDRQGYDNFSSFAPEDRLLHESPHTQKAQVGDVRTQSPFHNKDFHSPNKLCSKNVSENDPHVREMLYPNRPIYSSDGKDSLVHDSPHMQKAQMEDVRTQSPFLNKDLHSSNKIGPKNVSENDPHAREMLYSNRPLYSPSGKDSLVHDSPHSQKPEVEDVRTLAPFLNKGYHSLNKTGSKNISENDPHTREMLYSNRPFYSSSSKDSLAHDSPYTLKAQEENSRTQSPFLNKDLHSPHKVGSKNVSESDPHTRETLLSNRPLHSPSGRRYENLPAYAPGFKNIYEDNLQPSLIPVGGIRDIEYEDREIRTALSKDNDLFEGAAPNKFIPNLNSGVLPCCHYCQQKFKQDELAIAIPERSDAIFHTECFKCHGCNQILADMFYFYDKESDNIYCGRDYAKIRGIPRCRACDELIFVKEYCLAENSTFHVKHFCCFECDKPLAGQNYVMENDQPVCVPCYELTKANKCYACKEVIHPDQQGLQLKDGVHFHATEDCFACKVCKKPLFGAKLLFRQDCLYCSHDCYNSDV